MTSSLGFLAIYLGLFRMYGAFLVLLWCGGAIVGAVLLAVFRRPIDRIALLTCLAGAFILFGGSSFVDLAEELDLYRESGWRSLDPPPWETIVQGTSVLWVPAAALHAALFLFCARGKDASKRRSGAILFGIGVPLWPLLPATSWMLSRGPREGAAGLVFFIPILGMCLYAQSVGFGTLRSDASVDARARFRLVLQLFSIFVLIVTATFALAVLPNAGSHAYQSFSPLSLNSLGAPLLALGIGWLTAARVLRSWARPAAG